ncbi:hypothetical protein AB205_0087500 [Aquarana catesbeiana]|uniref:Uncharacterized protein n=1 Tax=Aquarana catesbeiana TaxID=8400 RepID=A0A2G9R6R2_AQUCT|nr:hypothetical protein AB205_0087500 [Aquarana catesbeiana]
MYLILIHIGGRQYLGAPILLKKAFPLGRPPQPLGRGCEKEALVLINMGMWFFAGGFSLVRYALIMRACGLVWFKSKGVHTCPPLFWPARLH